MIPIPVINRGTNNDIVNTEATQRRMVVCGHCMVIGAERDPMEGRLSSGGVAFLGLILTQAVV